MGKQEIINKNIEKALDESIEMIRSGATIDDCLKLYPDHRDNLRDMLEAAACIENALSNNSLARPAEQFLIKDRQSFLTAIKETESTVETGEDSKLLPLIPVYRTERFRRAFAGMMASAATLVIAIGGLVHSSANSLPGSALYPVKRMSENVQLALTFDAKREAEIRYAITENRIDEATKLAKTGEAKKAVQVYEEAQNSFNEAQKLASNGVVRSDTKASLDSVKELVAKGDIKLAEKIEANSEGTATKKRSAENEVSSFESNAGKQDATVSTTGTAGQSEKSEQNEKRSGGGSIDTHVAERLSEKYDRSPEDAAGEHDKAIAPNNKATASIPRFEAEAITVSKDYLSPNGDGNNEDAFINVEGATLGEFSVCLYRESEKTVVIKNVISTDGNASFLWNGHSDDGRTVSDGEYRIKIIDRMGRVAHKEGSIIIDTKAPEIELVGPSNDVSTDNQSPRFIWKANNDSLRFTIYLNPAPELKAKTICITGLTDTFCDLPYSIKPGLWKWRVVAIDSAGNVGSSMIGSFTVEDPNEAQKPIDKKQLIQKRPFSESATKGS
jgi:tetratricopeptide (TPR) repeat protein